MSKLTRIEAVKDLIQEAIDKGATSVEQIHQTIAALPFDVLSKKGLLDPRVNSVKEKQAQTIGGVYAAIRRINQEVGDMATGLLESLEDHATVQRNLTPKSDNADDN